MWLLIYDLGELTTCLLKNLLPNLKKMKMLKNKIKLP